MIQVIGNKVWENHEFQRLLRNSTKGCKTPPIRKEAFGGVSLKRDSMIFAPKVATPVEKFASVAAASDTKMNGGLRKSAAKHFGKSLTL